MLSTRKKIAASAALLMAAAGIAATVQTASQASPADTSALHKANVSASILPGIIAPGKGLQSSASAKWAVTAHFSSAKEGKKVLLQRQSGTSWATAGKAELDKNGNVLFEVPRGVATAPVVYRVFGLGVASDPVSTARWTGTPDDFGDEFSGSSLSPDWAQRQQFYEPLSRRECSKGDPKAVKVGSGTAQLSVLVDKKVHRLCKPKKPGKSVIFGKFRYRLNANIGTQATHSITYGVVAARMKFQPLQGQHASLWMQPKYLTANTDAKTAGTEIDIIEWFGKDTDNGGLTSFIYSPTASGTPTKIPLGGAAHGGFIRNPEQYLSNKNDDWYKRYHVFSVEWTPSAYIFRIDGHETGRITKGISGVPEYPIISLLSSDYELANLPDREKSLPQTMNVDWIRTWQDPDHYVAPSPTAAPQQ